MACTSFPRASVSFGTSQLLLLRSVSHGLGSFATTYRRKHRLWTFISGIACFDAARSHVHHHRRNLVCAFPEAGLPRQRSHVARTRLQGDSTGAERTREGACDASTKNPTRDGVVHLGPRSVGNALEPFHPFPYVVCRSYLHRTSFTCALRRLDEALERAARAWLWRDGRERFPEHVQVNFEGSPNWIPGITTGEPKG